MCELNGCRKPLCQQSSLVFSLGKDKERPRGSALSFVWRPVSPASPFTWYFKGLSLATSLGTSVCQSVRLSRSILCQISSLHTVKHLITIFKGLQDPDCCHWKFLPNRIILFVGVSKMLFITKNGRLITEEFRYFSHYFTFSVIPVSHESEIKVKKRKVRIKGKQNDKGVKLTL